jgi:hypothetical protein
MIMPPDIKLLLWESFRLEGKSIDTDLVGQMLRHHQNYQNVIGAELPEQAVWMVVAACRGELQGG